MATICLALAFFFAELIVAPIWAVPMDIAPGYAGTASGMMNFGFGVASIISPAFFGFTIERTHNWTLAFTRHHRDAASGRSAGLAPAPRPAVRRGRPMKR